MRYRHGIANWLLRRLGVDDALTGDILEEYARGHSRVWYAKQVLGALCVSVWCSLRDHKLLAIRAICVGFGAQWAFSLIGWYVVYPWLRGRPMTSVIWWIGTQLGLLVSSTATAWVVARTHRAHQAAMLLTFMICELLWYVYATLGWVRMLVVDSIDQPRFRLYLAYYFTTILMMTAGTFLGGILDPPINAKGIPLAGGDQNT
jgi:hypothetical protein